MEILEALEDDLFSIPKYIDDVFLPNYIEDLYQRFLNKVDQITAGPGADKLAFYKNTIKLFCKGLIETIKIYYDGDPYNSYFKFADSLKLIELLIFKNKNNIGQVLHPLQPSPYYRARSSQYKNVCEERKDIFHVPFQGRNKVSSQRFSVPGMPCLYLSNSIYLCYVELNEKDFYNMPVSKILYG